MKNKFVAGLLVVAINALPAGVFARTQPGILGNPYNQNDTCFANNGVGGAYNTCGGASSFWSIPLVFDTAGTKTFNVTGTKQTTGAILTCGLKLVNPANGSMSTPATFNFTAAGYSTISRTATVTAGYMGWLDCEIGGSRTAAIVEVDYF